MMLPSDESSASPRTAESRLQFRPDLVRSQALLKSLSVMVMTHIYVLLAGCQSSNGPIEVSEAWAPATPPGATVGSAYMAIRADSSDTLIGASTPLASSVEMHQTLQEGDVLKMRKVEALDLAPNNPIMFEPGGTYFMLIGLSAPLQPGERVPMTLRFRDIGETHIEIKVLAPHASPAHH
jgi:periplasmic copper chaperone A